MALVTETHAAALARLGHALSDGTRTRILLALRDGPARPSALATALGVSKQTMSNHLACLRGCGLVSTATEGRNVWYVLANPTLSAALGGLLDVAVAVDPACCSPEGCACA